MNTRSFASRLSVIALALAGWLATAHAEPVTSQPFGATGEGTAVRLFTLRNAHGCEARITNYGGIIVSLTMPDRHGKFDDVVLGFDRLEDYVSPDYLAGCPYFGAIIGRYASRIARGTFALDGREYHVAANNGRNALHGGRRGFDKRVWEAETRGSSLVLTYVSPDGEEGFPGTLTTHAVYTLTDDNALRLDMEATTDKTTVVNLTQHSYFNLKGAVESDVLGHEVTIHAGSFLPVDAESIPLGELRPVAGTPFDFTKPTAIGAHIGEADEQLKNGNGYNHTFVLGDDTVDPTGLRVAAQVAEPATGRTLEVLTTQPGVQFYVGNFLDGKVIGKDGRSHAKRGGFCLEPQHYPDSPNRPAYPSVVLKPGETYRQAIIYRFAVKR